MSTMLPSLQGFLTVVVAPLLVLALTLYLIGFKASLANGKKRLFTKKRREDVFISSHVRDRVGSIDSSVNGEKNLHGDANDALRSSQATQTSNIATNKMTPNEGQTYFLSPSSRGTYSAYSSTAKKSHGSGSSRRVNDSSDLEIIHLSPVDYDVRRVHYGYDSALLRSFEEDDSPYSRYDDENDELDEDRENEEGYAESALVGGGHPFGNRGGALDLDDLDAMDYTEEEDEEEDEEEEEQEDLHSHFHKYMYGSPCLQLGRHASPLAPQHSPLDDALQDSKRRFAALHKREGEREQKIQQEVARSKNIVHADLQKKQTLLAEWEAEDRAAKEAAEAARVAKVKSLEALTLGAAPLELPSFAELLEEVRVCGPQETVLLQQAAALLSSSEELREKVEGYCDELSQDTSNKAALSALLSLAALPLFRRICEGQHESFTAASRLAESLGGTQSAATSAATTAASDALTKLEESVSSYEMPADVHTALLGVQEAISSLTHSVAAVASPTHAMLRLCDACLGIKSVVMSLLRTNDITLINKAFIAIATTFAHSMKSSISGLCSDDVIVTAFAVVSIFRGLNPNNAKHFSTIFRCALTRVCSAASTTPTAYSYSNEIGTDDDSGVMMMAQDACVIKVLALVAACNDGAARPPFGRADAWKWLVRYGKVLSRTLGSMGGGADKGADNCSRDCCVILEAYLHFSSRCFVTYYEDKFLVVLGAIEKTVGAARGRASAATLAAMDSLLCAVTAARAGGGKEQLFRGVHAFHVIYARFIVAAEDASRDNFQRLDKDPAFRAQRGYKESKMVRGDLSKALAEDIINSLTSKFILTKSVSADMLTVTVFRAVDEIIEKFQVPQNDERRAHPLAPVVVKLSEASPVFRELFRSQFFKACPWAVPMLQYSDTSLSEVEELHLMGRWTDSSGTFESDDKYEGRMLKLLGAFASVCVLTAGDGSDAGGGALRPAGRMGLAGARDQQQQRRRRAAARLHRQGAGDIPSHSGRAAARQAGGPLHKGAAHARRACGTEAAGHEREGSKQGEGAAPGGHPEANVVKEVVNVFIVYIIDLYYYITDYL